MNVHMERPMDNAIAGRVREPVEGGPYWFAVRAEPRNEDKADKSLRQLGYMTFYPFVREKMFRKMPGTIRKRAQWVEEPYFPGYLFCAIRFQDESLYEVDDADGVATVWRPGKRPMWIPDDVMNVLMMLGDKGSMPKKQESAWTVGKKFEVAAGHAFAGFIARMSNVSRLDSTGQIRAFLSVFGGEREVTLPAWAVAEIIG